MRCERTYITAFTVAISDQERGVVGLDQVGRLQEDNLVDHFRSGVIERATRREHQRVAVRAGKAKVNQLDSITSAGDTEHVLWLGVMQLID